MIRVSRILKNYRESGALNALLNVHAAVAEDVFLTKSGGLLTILKAGGVDAECLDASDLDAVTHRVNAAFRLFDEKFRVHQYLLKRRHGPVPSRSYPDFPLVQEAINGRLAHCAEKAGSLYSLDLYAAVSYEGVSRADDKRRLQAFLSNPVAAVRRALSAKETVSHLEQEMARAREVLSNKVTSFIVQLEDSVRFERLGKQAAFHFLRRLLNYAPHKSEGVRLKYDAFVDYQACGSTLECHRDHLRLDNYHVQVLTLKEPPAQTFAHMLRGLLELPSEFIVATEWKRAGNLAARRAIQSKRRHFHNSKASLLNYLNNQGTPRDILIDDSAAALVAELGSCLEELEVKGNSFGQYSLTVVLYDEDPVRLRRSVAECFKVFATHDAQVFEERSNLLNAWLAVIPGNDAYNLRSMWLLNTNVADLSPVFTQHAGELENKHLGTEYLAILETTHGTPYFLNLHHQDVAHTLVLGSTGSGKSFLLNFLVTHLQKYRPFTFVFDLGGSYEKLTRQFGGTVVSVGLARTGFLINPFSLPPTPENLQFIFSFVRVLIESSGYTMTAQDERDLYEQIGNVYAVVPEQRRLFTLSNIVSRGLRAPLQKWVRDGQYGTVFDNAEDNLTFARFQTFDFEGMDKSPQVLEPLLFYILHRANAAINDPELAGTFKAFILDEAWRFLRHPSIRTIVEALKTWRKKNAGVILATQSVDDLLLSETLRVVVESCPTKLFLANPGMDPAAYREIFHLNDAELGSIARLEPKKQLLLKRPNFAKVLELNVSSQEYSLYAHFSNLNPKAGDRESGRSPNLTRSDPS